MDKNIQKRTQLRIAVTGPESSGKTTLSKKLADHFKGIWIPEYAREYLTNIDRQYTEHDLPEIAKGQWWLWENIKNNKTDLFIADTDLLVIKIWSEYKYGYTHPFIKYLLKKQNFDGYILTKADIPWEEDELRENPLDRDKLFNMYLNELKNQATPYIVVEGQEPERSQIAIDFINSLK
ncbi:AAA family ATPase [Marinigracilibium pacificum]|uniref:ATP-binding protein n=1 Tax=Marinigracilibium pacificum TaxID=2729599 RepID=A0A848J0P7_9BACT|nr:ATP-binding protein [Marinigracilibium pacificum]NMM46822.1 ATP-binding protein [Marinigracilibium pacificum]